MPLTAALQDVRVVDLTRLLPGPFGTLLLADLGADVIKVEQPGVGDYLRMVPPMVEGQGARFRAVNRGKRSVALDLGCSAGREALLRIVGTADVVMEGFRPGVMDRLGIGFDALREARPDILLCSISGYGQTGPYRHRAGHDLNYVALSGFLAENAASGPGPMPVQIADLVGGGMFAVIGVLAALHQRRRDGLARHLDISMTEGVLALMGPELAELLWAGASRPPPGQGLLTGGHATYRVYPTADGRQFSVGALEPKFAAVLGEVLGFQARPDELLAGPRRQAELSEIIGERLASEPLQHWVDRLSRVDACCEPVLEPEELDSHPQHVAREVFRRSEAGERSGDGLVHTPLTRTPAHLEAPKLGQHTREILTEAGIQPGDLEQLLEQGVAEETG